MNTHRLAIVIGGILALTLIVGAFFAIKHNHQNLQEKEVYTAELPVPPEYLAMETNQVPKKIPTSEWEKLSDQEISNALDISFKNDCNEKIPFDFSEEIDLTGDDKPEGLFGCNAGNGELYVLLIKNGDKLSMVNFKLKSGEIRPVSFYSRGTVMYTSGFKLLPKQNAFYEYGNYYDNIFEHFNCGGVNTYKWNPKTQLFEWNAELTKFYTKKYQDNKCQWEDE